MKDIKNCLVVVNYNDNKTTINFIKSIKDYKNINLIVIVDNCSTDNSYKYLSKYASSSIKVLRADKNGGYGSGNNIGIKYVIETLGNCNIIISNPDIEVTEATISKLITGLNADKDCAVIAPVVLENGIENKGWKLPKVSVDVLLNIPYIHRFVKKLQLYNSKWYNKDNAEVDCVSGCFFIIKSDIMKKIDYFDEGLFLYYEENAIGKKIKNINKKILVDTKSTIVHHHSVSINNSVSRLNKYKILKRSQMYYHTKYNNMGMLGKLMLYTTNKITLFVLYIYYSLQGGRK